MYGYKIYIKNDSKREIEDVLFFQVPRREIARATADKMVRYYYLDNWDGIIPTYNEFLVAIGGYCLVEMNEEEYKYIYPIAEGDIVQITDNNYVEDNTYGIVKKIDTTGKYEVKILNTSDTIKNLTILALMNELTTIVPKEYITQELIERYSKE